MSPHRVQKRVIACEYHGLAAAALSHSCGAATAHPQLLHQTAPAARVSSSCAAPHAACTPHVHGTRSKPRFYSMPLAHPAAAVPTSMRARPRAAPSTHRPATERKRQHMHADGSSCPRAIAALEMVRLGRGRAPVTSSTQEAARVDLVDLAPTLYLARQPSRSMLGRSLGPQARVCVHHQARSEQNTNRCLAARSHAHARLAASGALGYSEARPPRDLGRRSPPAHALDDRAAPRGAERGGHRDQSGRA